MTPPKVYPQYEFPPSYTLSFVGGPSAGRTKAGEMPDFVPASGGQYVKTRECDFDGDPRKPGAVYSWAPANDPFDEVTPNDIAEHQRHAARGENHWFTCPLCDDEDPEG